MFKKLSGINKLILVFNFIAVALLFGAYLSLVVSPSFFYPLAFLGLGFLIIIFINLLFVLYWIILFKLHALLSFTTILIGLFLLPRLLQLKSSKTEITSKTTGDSLVKVMSYNVRLFDLYNWTNNKKTRDRLFQFIKNQETDIANFQEFYSDDSNEFINVDSLKKKLGFTFSHVYYTTTLRNKNHWGIATLSKFPIIGKGNIKFNTKGNNSCIYSDIVKDKDTVRFYNIHLQSIHFKNEDYKFIDSLNNNRDVDEVKGTRKILGKLKRAFVKRSIQVDLVIEHIKKSPYKVVVCGDFNDTPISYTYQNFSENLDDAFIQSGVGFGSTNNEILPKRIDYVFHSRQIQSYSFKTIKSNLSDHYPLSVFVRMGKN